MAKDKSKKKDQAVEPEQSKKAKKSKEAPAEEEYDDLDPSGAGDSWRIGDHVGGHFLVMPTAIREGFKTSNGPVDTIVADVVELDLEKPKKSEVHKGVLIFQTVLVNNLREKIGGGMVAAKLVKGEAKNGNSAPYLFERNDEAKKAAKAWLAANGPDLD